MNEVVCLPSLGDLQKTWIAIVQSKNDWVKYVESTRNIAVEQGFGTAEQQWSFNRALSTVQATISP